MSKGSEAELCARFRAWAEARGWTVYPEVSTWDFVLVSQGRSDAAIRVENAENRHWIDCPWKVGDQIAIQAKLRGSVDVLAQCLGRGPTYRMVLVPQASGPFLGVAAALGLAVASEQTTYRAWGRTKTRPAPEGFTIRGRMRAFPEGKPLWLPPVIPDIPAGQQSPRQLTKWRVGALRLCSLLRSRGWITGEDFTREKIDRRRWVQYGWIVGSQTPDGYRYAIGSASALPDQGWEAVSEQLAGIDTVSGKV